MSRSRSRAARRQTAPASSLVHLAPSRTRAGTLLAATSVLLMGLGACHHRAAPDDHVSHAPAAIADSSGAAMSASAAPAQSADIPADAEGAPARLSASTRHREKVRIGAGGGDSVDVWVVYPERSTRAPVVLVVHEIFGVTPWILNVADQLAADGFIAIAPDFLTGKWRASGDKTAPDSAVALVRALQAEEVQRRLGAAASFGMGLPAALPKYGIMGFCWGGAAAFQHAAAAPELGASIVFYGSAPAPERLSSVRAPVLALLGENDARVNATMPPADSAMRAMGKTFERRVFAGAGHGFLRAQQAHAGANLAAARAAWPAALEWLRRHLQ